MGPALKKHVLVTLALFISCVVSLGATAIFLRKPGTTDLAPGTKRMAARLATIAKAVVSENGYNNAEKIAELREAIDQSAGVPQEPQLRRLLAYELLKVGRNDEAAEQYCTALDRLAGLSSEGLVQAQQKLRHELALSYLRMAEQENCIAEHNCASCLVPIHPGSLGVHRNQRGSRLAMAEYATLLAADPDDLAARWLLNMAAMTVGEYPDQVPEQWRISPEAFASQADFPRFYDVAPYLGLDVLGHAGGVVVEDFDGDGYLDIMISSMGYSDQLRLFHSNGNGTFTDWTERAGLTGIVGGLNLVHADYDNDGHPDVLVLRGGWMKGEGRQPLSLLHNRGNGTFEDVTEAAGLLSFRPRQTAAWADFDGDGWLDLFVGNEPSPPYQMPCELFHNNRDGTFTECAARLGVAVEGMCKGVTWGDFNNDGRPDLYISRNGQANLLFRNDGPAPAMANASAAEKRKKDGPAWWVFTEVAEQAGVTEPVWSFPCWFWDYDNDGWEDLFVLGFDNSEPQLKHVAADTLGLPNRGPTPRLYRNRRDGTFEDVTKQVGLDRVLLSMGSNFGDLDNDGWLDFYVGTGDPDLRTLIPNRMFKNDGGKRFLDVTTAGGFGHLQKGHGIAFADLDNDGDQDVVAQLGGFAVADVAHSALFENPGFGNYWITLKLEGVRSNRSAIGVRIRVDVATADGPRSIYRTVGTGGSFGSKPLRQEIGLGQAMAIRQVAVTWPTTGRTDVYENLPLDRFLTVREGSSNPTVTKTKSFELSPTRGHEPPPATRHESKKK